MTVINSNALRNADPYIIKGMKLIRTLYESTEAYYGEDKSVLLNALKGGDRFLRLAHHCLCETIHETGLDPTKASVIGIHHGNLAVFFERLTTAEMIVRASIINPLSMIKQSKESIEQIRMAASHLKYMIESIENPKNG